MGFNSAFKGLNGYRLLKKDFAPRGQSDQNLLQINIHAASFILTPRVFL